MILLAAVAWRFVDVPVSADYAARTFFELSFECVVLWTYLLVGLWRRMR